jgi:hypothetical protein
MEAWASSAMGLLRVGKKKLPAALPEGGAKGRDGVVPCASSLGKEVVRSNRGREPWLLGAPAPGEPGHGCPAQGRPGRRAPWEGARKIWAPWLEQGRSRPWRLLGDGSRWLLLAGEKEEDGRAREEGAAARQEEEQRSGRGERATSMIAAVKQGGRRRVGKKQVAGGREVAARGGMENFQFARERAPIYRRALGLGFLSGPIGLGWAGPKC